MVRENVGETDVV